jgi:hypothetical protein
LRLPICPSSQPARDEGVTAENKRVVGRCVRRKISTRAYIFPALDVRGNLQQASMRSIIRPHRYHGAYDRTQNGHLSSAFDLHDTVSDDSYPILAINPIHRYSIGTPPHARLSIFRTTTLTQSPNPSPHPPPISIASQPLALIQLGSRWAPMHPSSKRIRHKTYGHAYRIDCGSQMGSLLETLANASCCTRTCRREVVHVVLQSRN